MVGVTRQTIMNYENGYRRPSLGMLAKLCRELQIEPSEIVKALIGQGERKAELFIEKTKELK